MVKFSINLDTKPYLANLRETDKAAYNEVVSTFVSLMETAAEKKWHKLPEQIHSSISFNDVVTGTLNAVMTTREIEPKAYQALEDDLHPLALLSDRRKDLISGEPEYVNWRNHFTLDTNDVSRETIEAILRKLLYLVRWFDIDTVSKSLMTNSFPTIDSKDVAKLPFQPALKYQTDKLGELHVGKFFHDIGAFNCGELPIEYTHCVACGVGTLEPMGKYRVCPKCNAGYEVEGE